MGITPDVYQKAVQIVSTVRDYINHYRQNAKGSDEIRVKLRTRMLDFIRAIAWAVSQIQNEDVVKVFQQINAFNDIHSNIQSILNTKKEIQGLDPRTAGLNPEVYNKAEIIVKFIIQKISLINSFASQFREEIKRMIKTEASKSKVIEMDFMY